MNDFVNKNIRPMKFSGHNGSRQQKRCKNVDNFTAAHRGCLTPYELITAGENDIMNDWKKNLVFAWVAQFFSISGFSFALPFAPFYLQELGVTDEVQIRVWAGAFGASAGVTMALMTPFWGYLADRVGRKLMTLRATLGGTLVLLGMGLAISPQMLLMFRTLQGVFTGTITAYLTLVVSTTPKAQMGVAIGLMNAAVFLGNSTSPLLGGFFAEFLGYRPIFFIAAGLISLSFCISLICVQEDFTPGPQKAFSFFTDTRDMLLHPGVLPIVGMLFLASAARMLQVPMLPLLVQHLLVSDQGVALRAGIVLSAAGVAAVLAGIIFGALTNRRSPLVLGMLCAVLGSGFVSGMVVVDKIWQLTIFNFLCAFFSGGLDPILKVLLTRLVPAETRGAAFGLVGSARALGWSLGAFSGGLLAAAFGLRSVFVASALLLFGILGGLAFMRHQSS